MMDADRARGGPQAALRVVDLTRRFGDVTAVDRLNLEVGSGEIVGFLGPNGAGKTTTLRLCSGLLRPDAGDVIVSGVSLRDQPIPARARMGYVPDRPFLYERLSAREFLDFIAALYDLPPADAARRAAELIARLELEAVSDAFIESYSLGMRQKVSIAAALLHDPPLVLLDEPLQGLDPRGARELKDLLRERAARGGGILVSTHLLEVAERLCDRVVILHRGRKVAEGSLDELRNAGGPGVRDSAPATLEDVFLALTREREAEPPA
jgi:ABC-2 type transport system ATP-binding protein